MEESDGRWGLAVEVECIRNNLRGPSAEVTPQNTVTTIEPFANYLS